jgi:hypothetical protein
MRDGLNKREGWNKFVVTKGKEHPNRKGESGRKNKINPNEARTG